MEKQVEDTLKEINDALSDCGVKTVIRPMQLEELTTKDYAFDARVAAGRIKAAVRGLDEDSPIRTWGHMVAASLEGYAGALEHGGELSEENEPDDTRRHDKDIIEGRARVKQALEVRLLSSRYPEHDCKSFGCDADSHK